MGEGPFLRVGSSGWGIHQVPAIVKERGGVYRQRSCKEGGLRLPDRAAAKLPLWFRQSPFTAASRYPGRVLAGGVLRGLRLLVLFPYL